MINLDTHILIDAIIDQLRPIERDLLDQKQWSISSIVLWEMAKLTQGKRIAIDLQDREVVQVLKQVHVLPIDPQVAKTSTQLDFSGDPADELIAATSIVYGIPLVTRDRVIRQSKLVPLAT